jgi:shikimate dehydrogenase
VSQALCGIVLHPAGHTLSPVLHAEAYRALGLDARFEVFDVPPGGLEAALAALRARGLTQLCVSLPHKETALRLADRASESRVRLARTRGPRPERSEADNTDWIGGRDKRPGPSGKRATVSARGAARAGVRAGRSASRSVANRSRACAGRGWPPSWAVSPLDEPWTRS